MRQSHLRERQAQEMGQEMGQGLGKAEVWGFEQRLGHMGELSFLTVGALDEPIGITNTNVL